MDNRPLDPDPRLLGNRLRRARETRGLTQQQVADHLGVEWTAVLAIESGTQRLDPARLIGLAEALGCGVSEILQGENPVASLIGSQDDDERGESDVSARDFVARVVAAWQRGELSEGQLARLLKTDRLGARVAIQRVIENEEKDDADAAALRT